MRLLFLFGFFVFVTCKSGRMSNSHLLEASREPLAQGKEILLVPIFLPTELTSVIQNIKGLNVGLTAFPFGSVPSIPQWCMDFFSQMERYPQYLGFTKDERIKIVKQIFSDDRIVSMIAEGLTETMPSRRFMQIIMDISNRHDGNIFKKYVGFYRSENNSLLLSTIYSSPTVEKNISANLVSELKALSSDDDVGIRNALIKYPEDIGKDPYRRFQIVSFIFKDDPLAVTSVVYGENSEVYLRGLLDILVRRGNLKKYYDFYIDSKSKLIIADVP